MKSRDDLLAAYWAAEAAFHRAVAADVRFLRRAERHGRPHATLRAVERARRAAAAAWNEWLKCEEVG